MVITEREQFYRDILTTALEGGIGYWSVARNIERAEHDLSILSVEVRDLEDETDAEVWHRIDVKAIAKTVRAIEHPGLFFDIPEWVRRDVRHAALHLDAGEIDAGLADVIVQLAIFGEVVYG